MSPYQKIEAKHHAIALKKYYAAKAKYQTANPNVGVVKFNQYCHDLWDGLQKEMRENAKAEYEAKKGPPARTQKAIGVAALAQNGYTTPQHVVLQSTLSSARDMVRDFFADNTGPFFARPCPKRPRHGFLESRPVQTIDEVMAVVRETLDVDAEGEVMVMPYINAARSAILTPSQITIGRGHDGATGGKAGSMTLPLAKVASIIADNSKARIDGTPYLETVQERDASSIFYVQLRDGPAPPPARLRHIGRDVVCKRIHVPTDDMLAWERQINEAIEGDIAYIPDGSMICHAAVHCIMHGVPVFLDSPPIIGQRYAANADEKINLDVDSIQTGLSRGLVMPLDLDDPLVRYSIMPVHQALAMGTTRDGAEIVGMALASLTRYGLACSLGELRHCEQGQELLSEEGFNVSTRHQVYGKVLKEYGPTRPLMRPAFGVYLNPEAFPTVGGSFGGANWAQCVLAMFRLDQAVQALQINPEGLPEALSAAHALINQCHNGGPLLSKLMSPYAFNLAAEGEPKHIVESAYRLVAQRQDHFPTQFHVLSPLSFTLSEATIETAIAAWKKKKGQSESEDDDDSEPVAVAPKKLDLKLLTIQVRRLKEEGQDGWRWQVRGAYGSLQEWFTSEPWGAQCKFLKKKFKSFAGTPKMYSRLSKSSWSAKHIPADIWRQIEQYPEFFDYMAQAKKGVK